MLGFAIYLISIIDNLGNVFIAASVVLGIFLVIGIPTIIVSEDGVEENIEKYFKLFKIRFCIILFCVSTFFAIFIPSSKTVAAMYLIPKMVKSDAAKTLSKLPNKALKIFSFKLDEYIDAYMPEKKRK